jgi:aspartyl-tRNA(Asn)/glutamyl-tRNA(Gln) amidotransferase subunit A
MDSIFDHYTFDPSTAETGPLQGLRIALQPNVFVQGWPAEAGSRALENFTAVEDATILRRLRESGAAVVGSTQMSEFGFGLNGSRAGEALGTKAVDVELVMDLMGESRQAAGKVGACGLKPSFGLLSSLGLIGLIPSMECLGLLAVNVGSIRKTLAAMAGPDPMDFSQPDEPALDFAASGFEPRTIRIGMITQADGSFPTEQQIGLQKTADELAQAGFSVTELSFSEIELFPLVHSIVGSVEASSCAGRYDSVRYGHREPGAKNWNQMFLRSRWAAFGPLIKSYLFQGAYFQFERYAAYEDACRIRARLVADMQHLFDQVDCLLLPAPGNTHSESELSLSDTYERFAGTMFANVTGQPALYLPPAAGSKAAGCQLAGARRSDPMLLSLGEHILNLRQGGKR